MSGAPLRVLQRVRADGLELQNVASEFQTDLDVVLAAVKENGAALDFAAEELKDNRNVVLTAVSENGGALELASELLRRDRDIVSAAVERHPEAIEFAADVLLEDESFLSEAKESVYLFRVTALSGSTSIIALPRSIDGPAALRHVLDRSCSRLGMQRTRKEALVYGAEIVEADKNVPTWPGSPLPGMVVDYQIVA
mmetsp:Transcript_28710/g.52302  ORF Transcript_28710/g.52302 Transcript_28710/m.52302 type:complete len:196 (-) Transcript_28710:52-639(-)